MYKSQSVRETAQSVYHALQDSEIEVLWDDRDERAGVMFADTNLLGIPHQIVIRSRLKNTLLL